MREKGIEEYVDVGGGGVGDEEEDHVEHKY